MPDSAAKSLHLASAFSRISSSKQLTAFAAIAIIVGSATVGALVGLQLVHSPGDDGTVTEPLPWSYPKAQFPNISIREFADYTQYQTSYALNAPQYSLEPGLANVLNLGSVNGLPEWSTDVANTIQENYFAAVPGGIYDSEGLNESYTQFSEIYDDNYWGWIPSFVTADSVLHTFHIIYDHALRVIEVNNFTEFLTSLVDHMLEESLEQLDLLDQDWWRDCAIRNIAYFAVAAKLLDPSYSVPEIVRDWVDESLSLIESESVWNRHWFMDQLLDFTFFTTRGHYTRSEELENFFKTMIWFGCVSFRLHPEDQWSSEAENEEKGLRESAQSILMCKALQGGSSVMAAGEAFSYWEAVYQPSSFLVGTSDDLTPHEYCGVLTAVYGENCSIPNLQSSSLLAIFMNIADTLRDPRILGNWMPDYQEMENVTKGMRFMGQRFVPDSFIFWKLVNPNVVSRLMPTGLDFMSVFGSDRAAELLVNESVYSGYDEGIESLKGYFSNLTLSNWTQNIYWSWIYSFLPILENREVGYPSFMTGEAWADKQLMTALGTWTELRHDTVLYAKQSVTGWWCGVPDTMPGYVEPVPELYSRLASLCRMLLDGLTERNLLDHQLEYKLPKLWSLLLSLKSIAEKELNNATLSLDDHSLLKHYGSSLRSLERFDSDTDRAALIVDVHTDPTTYSVLEEATGNPMVVFVAVPTMNGTLYIARGAMYSYYEFTQPVNDRMTDEAWWDVVDAENEPPFPSWAYSFIVDEPPSSLHLSESTHGIVVNGRQNTERGWCLAIMVSVAVLSRTERAMVFRVTGLWQTITFYQMPSF